MNTTLGINVFTHVIDSLLNRSWHLEDVKGASEILGLTALADATRKSGRAKGSLPRLKNFLLVDSQAASAGSNANIDSFSGSQSLNGLVSLTYNAAVVMLSVGLMAIGAAGFAGRGPVGGNN